MAKLYGKDTSAYDDIDIDELLGQLTEEQIEELGQELIDPDDSMIPPSERCRYKLDKKPSGPFNRKKLLDFLEQKAKEEKDWDEAKPYKKETRGKVYKPKAEDKSGNGNGDDGLETEWDEVLQQATEEELVDLAAILGFHGMLNQVQYHQAFVDQKEILGGGFEGIAKAEDFKLFENEPPNDTDVDASLEKMRANDPKLKEINLNNIKNISLERLCEFADLLKDNTNLEHLHMSNTHATDRVAEKFADSLEINKTLKTLNLESNYISGDCIVAMLESISMNQTVTEFRVANQRPLVLGHKIENRIADLIQANKTILKFGIFLEIAGPRVRVEQYLRRNNDRLRKKRMGIDEPEEEEIKVQRTAKVKAAHQVVAEQKNSQKEEKEEKPKEKEKEEEKKEEESEEEESSEEEDSEEEESD